MKNKEINKVFKQVLKTFVGEMLNPCDSFVEDIDSCETYEDLEDLLKDNVDFIFDKLGGEQECEQCEYKDDEINDLEYELTSLSDSNDDMERDLKNAFIPKTLIDGYKLEAFKKSVDKFSLSEIESLLD